MDFLKYFNTRQREKGPRWSGTLSFLLQAELLEQKHPHKIQPTERNAGGERDKHADDQAKQTALFHPSGPSDDNLSQPVDTGDEEQKELHQTALFVKPSHDMYLQNKFCTFILP